MATPQELLRREIKVLVFDLYGTVVDMQAGLEAAVTPFLQEKDTPVTPTQFVTWWRRTHFEDSMIDALCDEGHTPYREIGHRAVSQVMDRARMAHTQDEVTWLVAQIERLQPFADVPAALKSLARTYHLVVLSNGDRDMLEGARPHVGFDFDLMISVQEAGYFKPHHATYAVGEEIIRQTWPEAERSSVLFVANHPFDCIGAKAHGFRTAYIDRRGRPFGQSPHQPDLVLKNFSHLAEALSDTEAAVA